ncbi:MAG: 3-keto-disaccharide hydrolase [Aeoliella sp.]
MNLHCRFSIVLSLLTVLPFNGTAFGDEPSELPKAFVAGTEDGWVALGEKDFAKVNLDDDTFTWEGDLLKCTGRPLGVMRSAKIYTNFELVLEWRHMRHAGNSGVFVWATEESIEALSAPKVGLPHGIEVQVLDLGYEENFEKKNGKPADWFTSHGDVFPVGASKMKPFPPLSADGSRSFPSKNLTKPAEEWNHYYIRAINGEVRLWVNGEEVSGGTNCEPAFGYLALESEGAPIEFKNLRIRELP